MLYYYKCTVSGGLYYTGWSESASERISSCSPTAVQLSHFILILVLFGKITLNLQFILIESKMIVNPYIIIYNIIIIVVLYINASIIL